MRRKILTLIFHKDLPPLSWYVVLWRRAGDSHGFAAKTKMSCQGVHLLPSWETQYLPILTIFWRGGLSTLHIYHHISITTYIDHLYGLIRMTSSVSLKRQRQERSKQDYSNILLIPHYLGNDAGSMRGCFYQVFSRWASSVKRALDELRLYAQNPPLTDLLPGRASQNIRNCSEKKVLQE